MLLLFQVWHHNWIAKNTEICCIWKGRWYIYELKLKYTSNLQAIKHQLYSWTQTIVKFSLSWSNNGTSNNLLDEVEKNVVIWQWQQNFTSALYKRLQICQIWHILCDKCICDSNEFPQGVTLTPTGSHFDSIVGSRNSQQNFIVFHSKFLKLWFRISLVMSDILSLCLKVPMKWKIICGYLKGLSKCRRMAYFFSKYLFSF